MAETFRIEPDGPFSLRAAAAFGFGPSTGRAADESMRLAFVRDDLAGHAAVVLRQDRDGVVHGTLHEPADVDAVTRQTARILSLDHPGSEWVRVGERDPAIGRLQREHDWLRPVLFHSPYEAAAWAIISQRRGRAQALALRRRLCEAAGRSFELAGESLDAFPLPERLLSVEELPGLEPRRVAQLHALARAALEPHDALTRLQGLPGIGPFWANLIHVRATGVTDVLVVGEPRLAAAAGRLYGLDAAAAPARLEAIAEQWRPFRTWAAVLVRASSER